MAKNRTTFGKLQRERDKKAKAAEKAERRAARNEERGSVATDDAPAPARDQEAVLTALAKLHESLEAGDMEIEEFEERRDQLTAQLRID